jgi:hypothetical protein
LRRSRTDKKEPDVRVAAGLVPDQQVAIVVLDLICGWPPDLVVRRGQDLPQFGTGEGAAYGDVDVRGEPPLRFDGGEILHVIAEETPTLAVILMFKTLAK